MNDLDLIFAEMRSNREAQENRLELFESRVEARFDKVEEKISHLNNWKWKIMGGTAVLTAVVGIVLSLAKPK